MEFLSNIGEERLGKVRSLRLIESKFNEFQNVRKSKDSTLAGTTKLRVKIRRWENERDSVMRKIKESCL